MHTEFALISTLAWGLGLSFLFGYLASRLGVPALVGYLLAGISIAPTTPGFVGDLNLASQLSEVGVMLLMFGVGLHFSLRDLLRVKSTALPGAVIQMTVATVLGMGVASTWGWSLAESFILGLSLSCASTVVLLKGLEAKGWLQTGRGQLAVGWLVVEDLVTVLLLVLLPTMASVFSGQEVSAQALTVTILETAALIIGFVASMLLIAKRLLPWALMQTVRTGSSELFTLCVIAIAIGVAYASSVIFNVSFALGAFFAGMMMRESEYSHRAALQTLPLQDAFSVLFFLGVGMLFDPRILIEQPLHVLAVVFVIVFCKSITAMIWVRFKGRSHMTALTVGVSLSQVGEFSFILAGLGTTLGLLPAAGMSLILAGGIISIAINPLLFALIEPIMQKLFPAEVGGDEDDGNEEETKGTVKRDRVLIVGAGVIGHDLFFGLRDRKIESFVIEKNIERTHQDAHDEHFIYGDAATKETYEKVELERIRWMVITSTEPLTSRKIAEVVSSLDDEIRIIALVEREADIDFLKEKTGETIEAITQVIDVRSEVARMVLGALLTSRGLRSGAPKQLPKRQQTIDAEAQETETEQAEAVPSLEHKTEKSDKADKAEKVEESGKREKVKDSEKASDAKTEPEADKGESARKSSRSKESDVEESSPEVKEKATGKLAQEDKAEKSDEQEEPARKSRRGKKAEAEEENTEVKEEPAVEVKEADKTEAADEPEEPARKSRRSKKVEAEEDATEVKEEAAAEEEKTEKAEVSDESEEPVRKSRRGKKAEAEEEATEVKEAPVEATEAENIEASDEQEEPARKSRRSKKTEAEEEVTEVKEEAAAEEEKTEKVEASDEQEEPVRKSRRSKKVEAEEESSEVKEEPAVEAKEADKTEAADESEEPARKSRRGKKTEAEEEVTEVKEEATAEEEKTEEAEASDEQDEPARKTRRRSKKAEAQDSTETSEDGDSEKDFVTIEIDDRGIEPALSNRHRKE